MKSIRAKNLFYTRTFKLGLLGFLSGLVPIVIRCAYEHRGLSVDESIAASALVFTFATVLMGRANNNPVYTPDGLPGANRSDFQ